MAQDKDADVRHSTHQPKQQQEAQQQREQERQQPQQQREQGQEREQAGDEAKPVGWLNVIGFVIGLLFLPIVLNSAGLQHEALALLPNSTAYFHAVGYGTQLYLECTDTPTTGTKDGRPTVLIEADVGMGAEEYRPLMEALAPTARVCIYDRAGLGHSGQFTRMNPPTDPYAYMGSEIKPRGDKVGTAERAAEDLHWLLRKANVSLPVTLVSFGLSTMTSRFYSQLYEDDVAGIILINPVHESLLTDSVSVTAPPSPFYQFWYGSVVPAQELRQLSAFMGWTRLALMGGVAHVPVGMGNTTYSKHIACHGDHQRAVAVEMLHANETASQLTIINQFKPLPRTTPRHIIVTSDTVALMPYLSQPKAVALWRDGVGQLARELGAELVEVTLEHHRGDNEHNLGAAGDNDGDNDGDGDGDGCDASGAGDAGDDGDDNDDEFGRVKPRVESTPVVHALKRAIQPLIAAADGEHQQQQ
ncbi:hypothetical protein PTSG_04980 [Salpingoeca rosetta]|uniref:AB hydrolase-1 domain-containing protein n=1 Tax=Salpingoeca rosetta (strain ATCC 50818 / BSB-021) TaxID=946362 RepID=F2U964_SALR5|nr:uncharacterized protein PTSG_04980 [Salpingoeca rosetta]EGD73267.1 hypothetical protein PTSG_04980 [Salpingoeca rosetta]|eukprot:XP_004994298.1 hypothetical protein PTSG_04980 [Salpingoeca rosetta]